MQFDPGKGMGTPEQEEYAPSYLTFRGNGFSKGKLLRGSG
jgi:hypothetical protein